MSLYVISAIVIVSAGFVISDRVRKILADRRHQKWSDQRDAFVVQVGEEAAQALVNDLHARSPGLVQADRDWLEAMVLDNLWNEKGENRIAERHGLVRPRQDRPRFEKPIRARMEEFLRALPDGPRLAHPDLAWTPTSDGAFLGPINEEIGACPGPQGAWLAVRKYTLVECAPGQPLREVSPPWGAIDIRRRGFLARDPQHDTIALWQRAWAQQPGQTFFLDRKRQTWRTETHEYRSEDEYGGVCLIFDAHRGQLVRHGVTYSAAWSPDQGWQEQPAGLLQLALSGDNSRVCISDPELAQTLVLDLQERRVMRASPRGWALVATLSWPPDLSRWKDRFPDYSILCNQPARLRYEPRSKRLLYIARGDDCYELDLRPALDAAAALDA